MTKLALILAAATLVGLAAGTPADARATDTAPTCSDILDIEVHGQHVVGDYVSGLGHHDLQWPPKGGVIGRAVSGNRGAVTPGGPGPGYHFPNDVPPGASFCVDARSGDRD